MNSSENTPAKTETTMKKTAPRNKMMIRPTHPARSGWDKAFQEMAAQGDDMLLDTDHSLSSWDEERWEW